MLMKYYIGLDAHGNTCTFVVVDAQGVETHCVRVATTEKNILNFVRSISGGKSLTTEEGQLSQWLYSLLKNEVDNLVICNPLFISKRSGPKDDAADARHLAQQLRGNFLTPVFHEVSSLMESRSLMTAYLDVVKQCTQTQNRYKALFAKHALVTTGKRIYRLRDRIAELPNESDRFVAQGLFEQIRVMRESRLSYARRFREFSDTHSEVKALTTIPGIAEIRACLIAASVTNPARFQDKHHFWSYCELVRHHFISDGVIYGKRTKRANRHLKAVFMGAAKTAMTEPGALRDYYDAMIKKGLPHKAARKNLARQIASVALAVMRTKKPYDDSKVKEKIRSSTVEKI